MHRKIIGNRKTSPRVPFVRKQNQIKLHNYISVDLSTDRFHLPMHALITANLQPPHSRPLPPPAHGQLGQSHPQQPVRLSEIWLIWLVFLEKNIAE
jgi:hypothetical protein